MRLYASLLGNSRALLPDWVLCSLEMRMSASEIGGGGVGRRTYGGGGEVAGLPKKAILVSFLISQSISGTYNGR